MEEHRHVGERHEPAQTDGARLIGNAIDEQPPEAAPFQVNDIVLFRSNLSPQGATYLPLKVIPLGG